MENRRKGSKEESQIERTIKLVLTEGSGRTNSDGIRVQHDKEIVSVGFTEDQTKTYKILMQRLAYSIASIGKEPYVEIIVNLTKPEGRRE